MGREVTPAEMPASGLILWAAGLMTIISLASTIWTIFSGPSRKNSARLDDHGKRLDGHDLRLIQVEQSQQALPSSSDMHQLELAMERLKGELQTMTAIMKGQSDIMQRLETIVSRHENHLLEGGQRR